MQGEAVPHHPTDAGRSVQLALEDLDSASLKTGLLFTVRTAVTAKLVTGKLIKLDPRVSVVLLAAPALAPKTYLCIQHHPLSINLL